MSDTRAVLLGVMLGFPVLVSLWAVAWLIGAMAYALEVLR